EWPPKELGLVPPEGMQPESFDGRRLYRRLVKKVGSQDVVFCLVYPQQKDDPRLFYIMENKAWNGLFQQACQDPEFQRLCVAEQSRLQIGDRFNWDGWKTGAKVKVAGQERALGVTDPMLPVLGANFFQADCFAQWLLPGGLLPRKPEWEKA